MNTLLLFTLVTVVVKLLIKNSFSSSSDLWPILTNIHFGDLEIWITAWTAYSQQPLAENPGYIITSDSSSWSSRLKQVKRVTSRIFQVYKSKLNYFSSLTNEISS